MDEQKKISLPEGIIMTLIVLLADITEFLVDLTIVGIIAVEILNFIIGGVIQLYLFLKGIKGLWKMGTNGLGTITDGVFASFLPIKTVTWFITWYLVNKSPKAKPGAEAVAGKAGKTGGISGKIGKIAGKIK
jgi:hypothetical protein